MVNALDRGRPLPARRRLAARLAVAAARVLAALPPRRIHTVLILIRTGATPATPAQARAAREAVVTVSVRCAGQGCLQRSLATALLCRLGGTWPTWRTGVRMGPFRAHAWVEADGIPIGEREPAGYFTPTLTVPPRSRRAAR
ncbi:lasso peptide biosynthesis B2 protein [Streptomyces litchfieldiae]|uniref:Lasso peptide biosynthesis B2 protein n=1 Tax=Streptomyces litchfieldiae TaxID=3075543 RepID=A0ABU2MQ93_9ACTN|nr:lasso peptide biosynthesis B2 protein [Streptomyces sp. DSM 44938]MDT0343790.1 lasso peptide biosynthesis B2 protein [Streptomyces sp. DSM 44938]